MVNSFLGNYKRSDNAVAFKSAAEEIKNALEQKGQTVSICVVSQAKLQNQLDVKQTPFTLIPPAITPSTK